MGRLLWLDVRHLLRERLALLVLVVGLICAAAAAWNGHAWLTQLSTERTAFLAEGDESAAAYRENLAAGSIDADELALAPVRVTQPLAYPVPILADFSIGRSVIEPSTATVRVRYRPDTLFRNYQIDNAERLARGRLDLSFVAVVLAPLLLIALGYGLFSSDRERGSARLVLAQAATPVSLLTARSINRFALVAIPIILAALALLWLGPERDARLGPASLWLAVALLGLLFWQGVILFVNSFRIRAETAALSLVALWALLVFVAPATINAVAQANFPPPSRLAYIAQARAAEIAAAGAYENDHPELAADLSLPLNEQYRRTVARNIGVGLSVEQRLAPLTRAFETQLRGQQDLVEWVQWASPPMTSASVLASIAGTDTRSYAALRAAAITHLASFKRAILGPVESGRSMTLADYDALPRFEPPKNNAPLLPIVVLAALVMLLWAASVIRLNRVKLD
ncbi:MAG: DUF3526 domain-containing protein [Terricaulis sp.]